MRVRTLELYKQCLKVSKDLKMSDQAWAYSRVQKEFRQRVHPGNKDLLLEKAELFVSERPLL
ncbi:unnamed protein product [Oikopleura dioica]|uniref:Uncharacterized protein n=1 Tax=Oikopleura dioica TaxID=34765 RepID=E4XDT1_OIKDI|nr:unnamed protein product [Oikopleura dioica]